MANQAPMEPYRRRQLRRRRDQQFAPELVDYDEEGNPERDYRCRLCGQLVEYTRDGDPFCDCPGSDNTRADVEGRR